MKFIIERKPEIVNKQARTKDHPVEVLYLDNQGSNKLLLKLVGESIRDKNLIAYIGCKSSTRACTIAQLLPANKAALIGSYSLMPLLAEFQNMNNGEIGIKEVSIVLQKIL